MVLTFMVWPGLVCRLYRMDSVGTRRLPLTCTSSISCRLWDWAVVAIRIVQKIARSLGFIKEALVKKAAIVSLLTVSACKTFEAIRSADPICFVFVNLTRNLAGMQKRSAVARA